MTQGTQYHPVLLKIKEVWLLVPIVLVVCVLIVGFLSSIPRTREVRRRNMCRDNLKNLWQGCYFYALDNDSIFPDDLSLLYPRYVASMRVFICPGTPSKKRISETDKNTIGISYYYTPSYHYVTPPVSETDTRFHEYLIAYDRANNHWAGGRNVLTADGHAWWVPHYMWPEVYRKHLLFINPSQKQRTNCDQAAEMDSGNRR